MYKITNVSSMVLMVKKDDLTDARLLPGQSIEVAEIKASHNVLLQKQLIKVVDLEKEKKKEEEKKDDAEGKVEEAERDKARIKKKKS